MTQDTYPCTEFNWGHYFANFLTGGEDARPDSSGLSVNERASSGFNATTVLTGEVSNVLDSYEKYTFAFQFVVDNNGNNQVVILGREPGYTGTRFLAEGNSAYGHIAAENSYEATTGRNAFPIPTISFDIKFQFDPTRETSDNYTRFYYFDEDGVMQSQFIRYPGDKVEITYLGGSIDITDAAFDGSNTQASGFFKDKVLEHLREAAS